MAIREFFDAHEGEVMEPVRSIIGKGRAYSAGSFAAAARGLGLVPSALTYRVRQIEDALDVLLANRPRRLTPDALAMLQAIEDAGSFAAAARGLGLVPSALTYRVRQIEDALDVLLSCGRSRCRGVVAMHHGSRHSGAGWSAAAIR
ncbi:LysR family transcriptional regulator [Mycobacterium tuberculosis]|uniref:LysR family transcriptional regulator n=1 Tax=Mycobacterium tuberculosis TaxID=1773 RepID=UPI00272D8888|nr:LysR family transcriptional regulator [Mycobacterium tuberculosis]